MAGSINYNFVAQDKTVLFDSSRSDYVHKSLRVSRPTGSWKFNSVTQLFEPVVNNEIESGGYLSPGFTNFVHSSADVSATSPWILSTGSATTSSATSIFKGHQAFQITLDSNFNQVSQQCTGAITAGTVVYASTIVEHSNAALVTLSLVGNTAGEIASVTYDPSTKLYSSSGSGLVEAGVVTVLESGPNSGKVLRLFIAATLPNAISSSNYLAPTLSASSTGTGQTLIVHSINGYLDTLGPPIATDSSNDVYSPTSVRGSVKEIKDEGTFLVEFSPYLTKGLSSEIFGIYPSNSLDITGGGISLSSSDSLLNIKTDGSTSLASPTIIQSQDRILVLLSFSVSQGKVDMIDSHKMSFVSLQTGLPSGLTFMNVGTRFNGQIHQISYIPYQMSYQEMYNSVAKIFQRGQVYDIK